MSDLTESGHGDRLSPRQARLVLLLSQGHTTPSAAKELGIPERRARRWRSTPAVKAALGELTAEAFGSAAATLAGYTGLAIRVLANAAQCEETPTPTRLTAAKSILELALRLRETVDLEQRLIALESQLARITNQLDPV